MTDPVRPSPSSPEFDDGWWRAAERRAVRGHRLRTLAWNVDTALRALGRASRSLGGRLRRPWVALTVIVVLASGTGLWFVRDSVLNFDGSADAAYPEHAHPSGEYATSSPGAMAAGSFDGTPAVEFAEGSGGIVLPAAKPTAGLSAKQIGAALAKVRKALIAGRLDQRMLVDHDTSVFLALFPKDVRVDLRGYFRSAEFRSYATWIDPSATLTSEAPRVSGRTTYRAATWNGHQGIEVVTNYVWVYAFSEGAPHPGGRLAVVHDEVTWFFPGSGAGDAGGPRLWLRASESYSYGMDCEAIKKGLLAPWQPSASDPGDPDPEHPDSYFDPNRSLKVDDACRPDA